MDPYWTIGKITNRIDEQWDLVLDRCIRICPRIGRDTADSDIADDARGNQLRSRSNGVKFRPPVHE